MVDSTGVTVDRASQFENAPAWGAHAPRGLARGALRASEPLVRRGITRPIGRLLQRLFRALHGPVVDAELWGLKLRLVDDGNLSERRALFTIHRFDPGERRFLAETMRAGDVFLDVGANAGLYTYWVSSLGLDSVHVLAFEPIPALAAQCRFNIEANGLDGVEVHACALGESAGESTLGLDASNVGKSALGGDRGGVTVPVRRLSDVLEESSASAVRCMKIDIEGVEPSVLRDLFENAPASRFPEFIIIETLHDGGGDASSILRENGYTQRERFRMNSVYAREGAAF